MNGRIFRIATIAMIFMGTVVGAGFASGQEIFHFFTRHGALGTWGVIISTLLLSVLGSQLMLWGKSCRAESYRMLFSLVSGAHFGKAGDLFLTVMLLVLSGVMVAGSGALTKEMGGSWTLGAAGTAILGVIVLSFRLSGIRNFNFLIVPLLIGTGVAVAGTSLFLTPQQPSIAVVKGWPISALLYSGYNLLLALPVLVVLHQLEPDEGILRWGGWIGGMGLGLTAILFHLALYRASGGVLATELPLLPILTHWGRWFRGIYAFVLWGELFTTYIANVYGLVQRWGDARGINYRIRLIVIVMLSVLIGHFGFAPLIQKVYPVFGFLSLLLLAYLFLSLKAGMPEKAVKSLETNDKV